MCTFFGSLAKETYFYARFWHSESLNSPFQHKISCKISSIYTYIRNIHCLTARQASRSSLTRPLPTA